MTTDTGDQGTSKCDVPTQEERMLKHNAAARLGFVKLDIAYLRGMLSAVYPEGGQPHTHAMRKLTNIELLTTSLVESSDSDENNTE